MIAYQLKMNTGPTPGKTIQLVKPELFIGREVSNDVVITDADISRKHARLVLQGEGYLLEDLGSTNGTFLNGERLTAPKKLQPGDLIRLGETIELVFELPALDELETALENHPGASPSAPGASPAGDRPLGAAPLPAAQPPAPQPVAPQPFVPRPVVQPSAPLSPSPLPPASQFSEPASGVAPKKRSRAPLIIGIGCLVLLCLCVLAGIAIYLIFFPSTASTINW